MSTLAKNLEALVSQLDGAANEAAAAGRGPAAELFLSGRELMILAAEFVTRAMENQTAHAFTAPENRSPFNWNIAPLTAMKVLQNTPLRNWSDNWWTFPPVQQALVGLMAQFMKDPGEPTPSTEKRGVVIAAGGWRFFPSAYVTVKMLRAVGCNLPVEIWYLGDKREYCHVFAELLDDDRVRWRDANAWWRDNPDYRIKRDQIDHGWMLKPFAVAHANFDEVIFLDADCYPVENPEFLFATEAYKRTHAIFFPDQVRMREDQWRAFGLEPREGPCVESGCFLLDRKACWLPLRLACFLNAYHELTWKLIYGDCYTFSIGFAHAGQEISFPQEWPELRSTCYLHRGFEGEAAFVHRTGGKFVLSKDHVGQPIRNSFNTEQCALSSSFVRSLPGEVQAWEFYRELEAKVLALQARTQSAGLKPGERDFE